MPRGGWGYKRSYLDVLKRLPLSYVLSGERKRIVDDTLHIGNWIDARFTPMIGGKLCSTTYLVGT